MQLWAHLGSSMTAPDPKPDLRVATFREQAAFEAYKEAIKNALESANKAAETVATAGFSIATAYGALLGLARPKDAQVEVPVLAPIIAFAVAALIALASRSWGVRIALTDNTVDSVVGDMNRAIWIKRGLAWLAILLLIVALGFAGWIVVEAYVP